MKDIQEAEGNNRSTGNNAGKPSKVSDRFQQNSDGAAWEGKENPKQVVHKTKG